MGEAPLLPPPASSQSEHKSNDGYSVKLLEDVNENTHNVFADGQGEIQAIPKLHKVETFEQKLYRKFSEEPLVPVGCVFTAYFLGSGIRSFMKKDIKQSQTMMRARVGAQFATILVFIGYSGYNSFNFDMRSRFEEKSN